jgi:hypothetical protein
MISERRIGNDAQGSCLGKLRGITQSLSAVTNKTTEIRCKEYFVKIPPVIFLAYCPYF